MKKIILSIAALAIAVPSFAQWTSGPGNINNTNTGNVGIGTTDPAVKLHVAGQLYANGGINKNLITFDAPGAAYGQLYTDASNDRLYLGSSNSISALPASPVMTWDLNSSNVGIGTTSPLTALQIQGSGGSGNNLSLLTLTDNIARSIGSSVSIDFNPTSDLGSVYGRVGSVMEASSTAGVYISTYNPASGFGERLRVDGLGNVAIGTTDSHGYKLAVNGNAIATSMTVKLYNNWPDYVFKKDYHLPELSHVKSYIDQNHHLPEMPSEQEVKDNGINLGEIVKLQTKKIEELTLYAIQQKEYGDSLKEENKKLKDEQQKINQAQEVRIAALEKALSKLINR